MKSMLLTQKPVGTDGCNGCYFYMEDFPENVCPVDHKDSCHLYRIWVLEDQFEEDDETVTVTPRTDGYVEGKHDIDMDRLCDNCGERYGRHNGADCPRGAGRFRTSGRYKDK